MKLFLSKNRYNLLDPYAKDVFRGLTIRLYTILNLHYYINSKLLNKNISIQLPNEIKNYFQFMPLNSEHTNFESIEYALNSLELEQSQLFFKNKELENTIFIIENEFYKNNEKALNEHKSQINKFCNSWGAEIAFHSYVKENKFSKTEFQLINFPTLIYKYFYGVRLDNSNCIIRKITNNEAAYEPKNLTFTKHNPENSKAATMMNQIEFEMLTGFINVFSKDIKFTRKLIPSTKTKKTIESLNKHDSILDTLKY